MYNSIACVQSSRTIEMESKRELATPQAFTVSLKAHS